MDNLSIYQSPYLTGEKTFDSTEYGILVDRSIEKTVEIYKNADQVTPEQVLDEALYMKLGVEAALKAGERTVIASAPGMSADGDVMVPLEFVLEYLGYPYFRHSGEGESYDSYDVNLPTGDMTYIVIGRDTASVNNELVYLSARPARDENGYAVVALDDVSKLFPGIGTLYDDMGLVVIYQDIYGDGTPVLTRENDLDTMLAKMKQFVFDIPTGNDDESYTESGEMIYDAIETDNGFAHPYLIVNQSTFDSLKGDAKAIAYAESVAGAIYADMAEEDNEGNYVGIKEGKKPENVYNNRTIDGDDDTPDTDDGYNPTNNALYEVEEAAAKLVELAFAYNVTTVNNPTTEADALAVKKAAKYAELAIDIMEALGEWVHWGPGYMINCANATGSFAIAYDWLYNYIAAKDNGAQLLAQFANTIYTKGVSQGVNSSKGEFCRFPRTSGYGDQYVTRTDSYNAISASGMILGALAIMNVEDYTDAACYLVGNNLRNLVDYGLEQYAPDGSYIESITYWALGTNALMKVIMSLESAAGSDLGFADAWGINTTFYYACYIANGKGEAWGYHETGVGSLINSDKLVVDTQMFYYAGKLLGDNKLVAIRQNQLEKGREVTMFDLLFAPTGTIESDATLELNYYMEGIQAFVSRSGWEEDDMFVGIMGGPNTYSPYGDGAGEEVFGQIDSGNFVYENLGIKWIVDNGSDYFTAIRYFGSNRFNYFRNNGEGHNIVIIPDNIYGQTPEGDGKLVKTYIDEDGNGSYAVVDNSNAYGMYSLAAKRGLLVVGDTVVIQDEIARATAVKAGAIDWVVNTYADVSIDRNSNGRVAYLSQTDDEGNTKYIRVTLVSANTDFKFSLITSTDSKSNLLTSTWVYDPSQRPLVDEEGRALKRLAITAANTLDLNVAVVFEAVEDPSSELEVGYQWTAIAEWDSVFTGKESTEQIPVFDSDTSKFQEAIIYAGIIYEDYVHLTTKLETFYKYLSQVRFILVDNDCYSYDRNGNEIYDPQGFDPKNKATEYYNDYVKFYEEYAEYRSYVLKTVSQLNTLSNVLLGK